MMVTSKVQNFLIDQIWKAKFWKECRISPYPMIRLLKQSQFWDKDKLENYQITHINDLLTYAIQHSSFYREYYHNRIPRLNSIHDLSTLPHITKDIVRNQSDMIKVDMKPPRSFMHSTSGSTGDPLSIQIHAKAQAFRWAGMYRFYDWWGIRPYDRNILIWARKATSIPTNRNTALRKIKTAIRSKTIDRTLFIDVFSLHSNSIKNYYCQSLAFKPIYLRGYLSGVVQFAELLAEAGLDASRLNIKLVIVTSETLHKDQRDLLEDAFSCPVANEYGSADAGLFAFECPQKGMHIFEEAVLLSPLSDGKLVVTEYHNYTMPLINYINNDSATISDDPCRCGRTLKVIREISGRINDYAITADGDKVSPFLFNYAIKELNDIGLPNSVKKYKVIQRGRSLDFYIVKDSGYHEKVTEYLTERIKKALGQEIDINYLFVDEIEREKSGKLRLFIQQTNE